MKVLEGASCPEAGSHVRRHSSSAARAMEPVTSACGSGAALRADHASPADECLPSSLDMFSHRKPAPTPCLPGLGLPSPRGAAAKVPMQFSGAGAAPGWAPSGHAWRVGGQTLDPPAAWRPLQREEDLVVRQGCYSYRRASPAGPHLRMKRRASPAVWLLGAGACGYAAAQPPFSAGTPQNGGLRWSMSPRLCPSPMVPSWRHVRRAGPAPQTSPVGRQGLRPRAMPGQFWDARGLSKQPSRG